jgi:replication-associated recombination protein RarA
MSIVLHPAEQKRFDEYAKNPSHAILLIAPVGTGKEAVLRKLAESILGDHPSGRLFEVAPETDKTHIGIEAIRVIKNSVKLASSEQRVVLIPNAHTLTVEAQNSLLKILEEPPKNVTFLLSSPGKEQLLDTVVSRAQVWQLRLPTTEQLKDNFKDAEPAKLQRALAISDRRVGLMAALLDESDAEHPLLIAIMRAKELLQETKFERLCQVELLAKETGASKELLNGLELTAKAGLNAAAVNNNQPAINEWRRKLQAIAEAKKLQAASVQTKLVLSNLFVRL